LNFNIRGAIFHNLKKMSENELTTMIQDSIQQGDEKFLPGLGVLFEVVWNYSEPNQREQIIQLLHHQINQKREDAMPFT